MLTGIRNCKLIDVCQSHSCSNRCRINDHGRLVHKRWLAGHDYIYSGVLVDVQVDSKPTLQGSIPCTAAYFIAFATTAFSLAHKKSRSKYRLYLISEIHLVVD